MIADFETGYYSGPYFLVCRQAESEYEKWMLLAGSYLVVFRSIEDAQRAITNAKQEGWEIFEADKRKMLELLATGKQLKEDRKVTKYWVYEGPIYDSDPLINQLDREVGQ